MGVYGRAGIPGRIPILMFRRDDASAGIINKTPYDWNCRFDHDFCNLQNDYNMALFQRHSDQRFPMFGESSMLYVNVSIAGNFQAARLETDYFDTYAHSSACLSITYLMYGTGATKLVVIQQDVQNKCIWIDDNQTVDTYGKWKEAMFTIDLREGKPRFFIEGHINVRPPNYGTIAISRVSLSYTPCDYDSTNYCHKPLVEPQPQPPEPPPYQLIPSAV